MEKYKVCHITSVHHPMDVRIFYRECKTLSKYFDVTLLDQSEKNNIIDNVKIIGLGKNKNKFYRFFIKQYKIFKYLFKNKYDIYHLHDPELFFLGVYLILLGKKVIFDIHENIQEQIKMKKWLPFADIFSKIYKIIDFFSAKLFYLILAETSYEKIYVKWTKNYEVILNMPDLNFFKPYINLKRENYNGIFYIGQVTKERGILTIIKALNILKNRKIDFYFHCCGPISKELLSYIENLEEYKNIKNNMKFYGRTELSKGYEISKQCAIGVSILEPYGNYLESYSTKIFEYMAIGLPIITSNFKIYTEIVEKNEIGYCVNPYDEQELADKIENLLQDNLLRNKISLKEYNLSKDEYNWDKEGYKLVKLYKRLLNAK